MRLDFAQNTDLMPDLLVIKVVGIDDLSPEFSSWSAAATYSIQLSRVHQRSLEEYVSCLSVATLDSSDNFTATPKPSVLKVVSSEERRR